MFVEVKVQLLCIENDLNIAQKVGVTYINMDQGIQLKVTYWSHNAQHKFGLQVTYRFFYIHVVLYQVKTSLASAKYVYSMTPSLNFFGLFLNLFYLVRKDLTTGKANRSPPLYYLVF